MAANLLRATQEPVPNCPGLRPGQFGTGCWPARNTLTATIGPKPTRRYLFESSQGCGCLFSQLGSGRPVQVWHPTKLREQALQQGAVDLDALRIYGDGLSIWRFLKTKMKAIALLKRHLYIWTWICYDLKPAGKVNENWPNIAWKSTCRPRMAGEWARALRARVSFQSIRPANQFPVDVESLISRPVRGHTELTL